MLTLFLLFLTLSAAQALAKANVTSATLGNGLKVVVLEDRSIDLVAIDVWVRAGTINETEENNGVSHFIEHLLFKRTAKRGPGEVDKQIESLGATLDALTSRDWAHYRTVVARRYLPTAVEIIADVIMRPEFDPHDIERERRIILDEIARRDSDYMQVAFNSLYEAAFHEHPYRFTEEGTSDNAKKLSRQQILDYYNSYYVPENTTVVIVGDVDAMTAVSVVGEAFQNFKKKDVPPLTAVPEPPPDSVVRNKIDAKLNYSHLIIGFRAPSVYDEPDVYAMDILLTYLGLGYRSWLAAEVREKQQLAVETLGDFLTQKHPSMVAFYLEVKPGDVEKAEEVVMEKIKEMHDQLIPQEELAWIKRSLEGSYAFQNETFSGKANTLGFYNSIKDYKFAVEYLSKIRAVTPENVRATVRKYLDPDRAVIVVVGQ